MSALTADQAAVLFPDVDTPFKDVADVVRSLLPYHIFQLPREDMGKGKKKATEADLLRQALAGALLDVFSLRTVFLHIIETNFALSCHKRKRVLEERFRRAQIGPGKVRLSPSPCTTILT